MAKQQRIGRKRAGKRVRRRRRGRHVPHSTAPPRLQAGAARRPITPPVGGPLLGIPERDLAGASRGVHDELHARALVLDNGFVSVALVSVDLFAIPYELSEEIARNVSAKVGISQDNIIIAASHTYSGPNVSKTIVGGEPDGDWLAVLISEVTNTVQAAFVSKRPARAGIGVGQCPITLNRRIRMQGADFPASGGVAPGGASTGGPTDPDLGILRVTALDGTTIAILANFACQPLTVGRDGAFLISADFPGVFSTFVESAFPGCVALFTNGAAADVVHRLRSNHGAETSGGYRNTILMGELLADEAIRLASTIRTRQRLSLAVTKKRIAVPLDIRKAPTVRRKRSKDGFEAVSKVEKQVLATEQSDELLDETAARYIAESRWVPAMAEMVRRGKRPRQAETTFWAVAIGTLGLVSVPGELYSRSGNEIKAKSPFKHTVLLGYAGDYLGFLAPRDVCEQGGWEVEEAHRFLPGPGLPLVAGTVEDTLIDHMLSLLRSLASKGARTRAGSSR